MHYVSITICVNFTWHCYCDFLLSYFYIGCYYSMIVIKINGIDIHCSNVILLFLASFSLYIVVCAASCTPAHFSEVIHLVAFGTFFPYARHHLGGWLEPQYLHSPPCHFNSCMQFHSILFTFPCTYFIKIFYLTHTLYNCCLGVLGLNSFCPH